MSDCTQKPNVDKLYIRTKDGGRRLIAIEDCVELAVRDLEVHVHESEERLLQTARGDRVDGLEAASIWKKQRRRRDCKIGRRKPYMASI